MDFVSPGDMTVSGRTESSTDIERVNCPLRMSPPKVRSGAVITAVPESLATSA